MPEDPTRPPAWLHLSAEVREAIGRGAPVVALESTVLAQGLPRPRNLRVGLELEEIVREGGAVPATVALLDGRPTVGLGRAELERIATGEGVQKLSTRDLPIARARRTTGATTVASTAWLAARAGIEVFATGGIGGVHRGLPPDVSADLTELQRTTIIVVCAGAKSILDLPATRELLETLGVPVLGWQTDLFPAFYTRGGSLSVDARVDDATEVAGIWRAHREVEMLAAMLLCVPIPSENAIDAAELEFVIDRALTAATAAEIRGKEITPYLLRTVAEATDGRSLEANVALLRNNVRIAAEVAVAVAGGDQNELRG
jgi:pseudouridylate synthase